MTKGNCAFNLHRQGKKITPQFPLFFSGDKYIKPQCWVYIYIPKREGLIASIRVSRAVREESSRRRPWPRFAIEEPRSARLYAIAIREDEERDACVHSARLKLQWIWPQDPRSCRLANDARQRSRPHRESREYSICPISFAFSLSLSLSVSLPLYLPDSGIYRDRARRIAIGLGQRARERENRSTSRIPSIPRDQLVSERFTIL